MTGTDSWLRGLLDMCLLSLLRTESYGYALARRLAEAGLGTVPGGTIYPALLRLERQGLVSGRWGEAHKGTRRRYYVLTEQGRATLDELAQHWVSFRQGVDSVVGTPVS